MTGHPTYESQTCPNSARGNGFRREKRAGERWPPLARDCRFPIKGATAEVYQSWPFLGAFFLVVFLTGFLADFFLVGSLVALSSSWWRFRRLGF